MRRSALALGLATAALLAGSVPATAAAPARTEPSHATRCPQLSRDLPWYGHNRAKLQRTIDERGTCENPGLAHGHGRAPVAAFDWDNTMTKNDVTDATLNWSLLNDKILRPAHWRDTSKWMTPAADRALTAACGTSVPVGSPLPTSTDADCADEILQIRAEAKTMSGQEAFSGTWNHRRTVPEYAWVPQLFAGHTEDEVRAYAAAGRKAALAAPVGATVKVGTHTLPAYVRYYDQQKDLVRTLRKAGFDVYIVSAGSKPVTEVWSRSLGFDRAHTVAIRSILDDERKLTYRMQGCGDMPDSRGDAIPYIDGKRCWINQEIFHIKGAEAWRKQDPAHRIALGGGDADTDSTFVADATGAHLVINRNKTEVMCRGYDNADGRWVINPMFIDPLPRKSGSYPCATQGHINTDGVLGPLRRPDTSVVPDQKDRIHG
ncbi:haloacid dehalogenase-like hydrolase [Streptomyces catenulae]|uniref:phosphoserine phosphatase n=1 Tax=Streptomyces catenulae TaxID=66875 RepID=A0ABV2Z0M9_9ACTN|nr:haloacid dehalogenase-like hydrolase [Streptomyces catenulae]